MSAEKLTIVEALRKIKLEDLEIKLTRTEQAQLDREVAAEEYARTHDFVIHTGHRVSE